MAKPKRKYESDILGVLYRAAQGAERAGVMSKTTSLPMPELIAFLEQTIKSAESFLEHRKEQVAKDEAHLEMLKRCLIALQ